MSGADDIEARAAAFLARRDRDDWTSTDERALAAWLDESDAHRVSYLRIGASWTRLDRLAALQTPARTDDTARPRRWRLPYRRIAAVAAALLLVVIGTLAYRPAAPAAETFTTAIGARRTIPLADGTKVELNTDSEVRVAIRRDSRHADLRRGEAYFEVAHDPAHPFVVEAGSRRIVVLGTKFAVRRDGALVSVRVLEGRVRVENANTAGKGAGKPVIAMRGDQILAVDDRQTTLVKRGAIAEVEDALTWREGLLTFEGITLGKAAAEFNRYSRKRLVVSGSAAAVEIEGSFAATDAEAFVRILHDAYGFRVENRIDEIIIS